MSRYNWITRAGVICLAWAAAAIALPAQTFTVLHNFCSQGGPACADGSEPVAPLYQAANGKLYGTTEGGGGLSGVGAGTIFTMTPEGQLTTIFSIHCYKGNCPEGANPTGPLVQATDGSIYGTEWGEIITGDSYLFSLTLQGKYTAYQLCTQIDCPFWPKTGMIQATDGNLYGTTLAGGSDNCGGAYCGTIFQFTPAGHVTTVHVFDLTNGAEPEGGVIQGPDGNLYGTTSAGGNSQYRCGGYEGCGIVYKLSLNEPFTALYKFCSHVNCQDGAAPAGNLLLGSDGNFYGVTLIGGQANQNCPSGTCGTIFKITPGGALTTLHAFDYTDGSTPANALIQGSDGNYYGTTAYGGANGGGTIFSMTPDGALTTLYNFCSQPNCADGEEANSLLQDTNGTFYATTPYGGANGAGTAFSLSMGLGPFVKTNPGAAKAGADVGILGTDLTGATSVTFNGTTAEFKVIAKTLIVAEVLNGATTGTVKVKLPGGTLSSNVAFYVLK